MSEATAAAARTRLDAAATAVATVCLTQAVLLVVVPYIASSSPPLDVAEGLTWAPHWLLGTHKHPPMPSWTLAIAEALGAGPILAGFLLSQIAVVLTYAAVFRLGCLVTDRLAAATGTLLLAGTYYFGPATLEYNHNVLQLPIWAGILLTFAHLRRRPDATALWLALGVLVGGGLYVKYSVAVLPAVLAVYAMTDRALREQLATPRPYLAVALALALFTPHLYWLAENNFQPLVYAATRAAEVNSRWRPLGFLGAQVVAHAAVPILMIVAGWHHRRRALVEGAPTIARRDLVFLRVATFAPAGVIAAAALFFHVGVMDMWAMPMFTTVGLWLVAELRLACTAAVVTRLARAAVVIIGLVALTVAGHSIVAGFGLAAIKPARTGWPMRMIGATAEAFWAHNVDTPLRLVGASNAWDANLAALGAKAHPAVILSNLSITPWVRPADVARDGVLFIARSATDAPSYCTLAPESETVALGRLLPTLTLRLCRPQPTP